MTYPEKILQIGEGNFLRAFLEPLVEQANRQNRFCGSVVIVPPRKWDTCAKLAAQECRYTVCTRGKQNGEIVDKREQITCVSRCIDPRTDADALFALMRSPELEMIVSNTTEAGIYYCKGSDLSTAVCDGYAALLTRLLWERFQAGEKELWILPCELIENNADTLLSCVRQYAADYALPAAFSAWLDTCFFCNTLVDRIVSGHPEGDADALCTVCEPYFFWAVEFKNPDLSTFPLQTEPQSVCVCTDISPYRMRKVRLLNGMHTAVSAAAFLSGFSFVRELVKDGLFRRFLQEYSDGVIAVTPMDTAELTRFRDDILERFENPFLDHRLQDICMNSVSKFNARCKDVMLYNDPKLVKMLCFTLAAILHWLDGKNHVPADAPEVLSFAHAAFPNDEERVKTFLQFFAGTEKYLQQVLRLYQAICRNGAYATLQTEAESWK